MTNGQKLRAVGQVIEQLKLSDFTIEVEGREFLVSGERIADSRLGALLSLVLSPTTEQNKRPERRPVVEFRCTPELLEGVEKEGRTKRRALHAAPTPMSPSDVLRNVGNYLDLQRATLIRLSKVGHVVTVRVKTASGTATVKRFLHSANDRPPGAQPAGENRTPRREALQSALRGSASHGSV